MKWVLLIIAAILIIVFPPIGIPMGIWVRCNWRSW